MLVRVALVVASALALMSCGGDDSNGEAAPTQVNSIAGTATETETGPEAIDAARLAEIREDYERKFSTSPWYIDPARLDVLGGELEAKTDWRADAEGNALALQLCNALHDHYTLEARPDLTLEVVAVYGAGNPPPVLAATDFDEQTCKQFKK